MDVLEAKMDALNHNHNGVHVKVDEPKDLASETKTTPPEASGPALPSSNSPPTMNFFSSAFGSVQESIVEAGVICEVKDLYKGKENCPCCITWSIEPQKKLPTTTSTDTGGYAVLARKTEGHGDFGRELKLHSIVIQSPLIRDVLEHVLKGYPGLTTELTSLTVESPFACFYHRWDALKAAFEASTGDTAEHMGLLMKILEAEFQSIQKSVGELLKHNVIEHKYIWTLFEPGALLYTKTQDQDAAMILEDSMSYDDTMYGGNRGFALICKHVDYNGTMTGYGTIKIKIPEFRGSSSLSDLPAIPLRKRPDHEELEKKLGLQGLKFAELRTGAFLQYSGKATLKDEWGYTVETQVRNKV